MFGAGKGRSKKGWGGCVGVGKGWVGRWKMLACENKLSATAADTCILFCDVMDVVFHKCFSQQYSLCLKVNFQFCLPVSVVCKCCLS